MNNETFKNHVGFVRRTMPTFSMMATLLSYTVAAIVLGYLLDFKIDNPWISYGISTAAQVVRMVIVFFGQLNPKTPDFGYLREGIAAAFGAFTVYEVWGLGTLAGWEDEIKISLTILMVGGTAIEIMLLQSIKTFNRKEIMSDPGTLAEIQNTAKQTASYKMFMRKIADIENGEGDLDDLHDIATNADLIEIRRLQGVAESEARQRANIAAANDGLRASEERALKDAETAQRIAREATATAQEASENRERIQKDKEAQEQRFANERLQLATDLEKARQELHQMTQARELTMKEALAIADVEEAEAMARDREKVLNALHPDVRKMVENDRPTSGKRPTPPTTGPKVESDEEHAARIARNASGDEGTFDIVTKKNGSPRRQPAGIVFEVEDAPGK